MGAGTDPQEGSALARAILQNLVEKKAPNLIATHYPELKAFAHSQEGVMNASMEFDIKTLKPTYHLILGIPGRSNALAIASRLGMEDKVIEDARSLIDPGELRTDDLLDEIHSQLENARSELQSAREQHQKAEEIRDELQQRLDSIEDERLEILENTRKEMLDEIDFVREELNVLRKTGRKHTTTRRELETDQEGTGCNRSSSTKTG